ncbi:MAG: multiheme c-type cytochrome [Myxococcota bacterium]|nr:multiheme c-type cytochrome [Myxococcota bacterium]
MRRLGTLIIALIVGCSGSTDDGTSGDGAQPLTRDELLDPESCKACHQAHYDEWSGSMHAYASLDPVFLAMNARGQRETGGELGDFCVQCHAPMALRLGLTTDGLNLHEVPAYAQGITCYFCHTVEAVDGAHNNPLVLSDDLVMRGGYANPVENTAHASAYSSLLDREHIDSASLCGSCHDIVTPKGVHLERTYAEWQDSLFSHEVEDEQQTCGNCHMPGRDDTAAEYDGVFVRRVHNHQMPGVDVALTPFPQMDEQLNLVQRALNTTVVPELCVVNDDDGEGVLAMGTTITVTLENQAAGHSWPSGAAPDRRAWVEVIAYDADDNVLYASGVVDEGTPVAAIDDEDLWELRDFTYDEEGLPAHFFWEVDSVFSTTLPAPTAQSPLDPDFIDVHRSRMYRYDGPLPARVTLRVNIRPIGLDILQALVDSGDLDPMFVDAMPTFTLGFTELTWTPDAGGPCVPATSQ